MTAVLWFFTAAESATFEFSGPRRPTAHWRRPGRWAGRRLLRCRWAAPDCRSDALRYGAFRPWSEWESRRNWIAGPVRLSGSLPPGSGDAGNADLGGDGSDVRLLPAGR